MVVVVVVESVAMCILRACLRKLVNVLVSYNATLPSWISRLADAGLSS